MSTKLFCFHDLSEDNNYEVKCAWMGVVLGWVTSCKKNSADMGIAFLRLRALEMVSKQGSVFQVHMAKVALARHEGGLWDLTRSSMV